MLQKSVLWVAVLGLWLGAASTAAFAARPVKQPIDLDFAGEFVVDCGDFHILEDCSVHGHLKIFTDHLTVHLAWECTAYNHLDPTKLIQQGNAVQNARLDFASDERTFRGLTYHITLPGYGSVFMSAGRVVFDPDFGVLFLAGRDDNFDPDATGPFCAALR